MDKFGFVLVNITYRLKTNESFALTSQINKVFYMPSHDEPQWWFVITINPRYVFYFTNDEDNEDDETLWNTIESGSTSLILMEDEDDEEIHLVRDDVEPQYADLNPNDDQINEKYNDDQINDLEAIKDEEEEEEDKEEEMLDFESSKDELDQDLETICDDDNDSSDE